MDNAIKASIPLVEHRCCARHIYANWTKKNKGFELTSAFWRIDNSTTRRQYLNEIEKLEKLSSEAHEKNTKAGCKAVVQSFFY